MAIPYEQIVKQDLNLGYGQVAVTMPAGGSALGDQIGLHTFNGMYNVLSFGAVGDGVTDDTAAIQLAIDTAETDGYGTVYFPPGRYKTTSGLTVTASNISLKGAGRGASFIFPYQTTGDVLLFQGAAKLQRNCVQDLSFYAQSEATSGALIHANWAAHFRMANCELCAYYGGLHLESVQHSDFINVDIGSDANFTTAKTNSYLLYLSEGSSGLMPSELHFVNCDWRGQLGNNYLQFAILITSLDGAFFHGVHAGFCQTAIYLGPQSNTTQLTGVQMTGFLLDTTTGWGILAQEPSTSYTGLFGAHSFTNGYLFNMGLGGMGFNTATTHPTLITAVDFQTVDTHGVQLAKGSDFHLHNLSMMKVNDDGLGGSGVQIEAGVTRVTINGLAIRQGTGNAPSAAVTVGSTCTDIQILGVIAEGCTYDIADNAVSPDKYIGPVLSSRAPLTVNASAAGSLDLEQGHEVFLLGTAYAVTTISTRSAFTGRLVTLVAQGAVTVTDGGNLALAGNFTMGANDSLTLRFDGTNWIEIGRSNN